MPRKDQTPRYSPAVVASQPVEFDGITGSALFVISTDSRDRDGDVVISSGCINHLPSYQANPVVLFDHGIADMMPVGVSEYPDTKLCTVQVQEHQITGRVFFHGETLLASQTARLVEKGVLRASSIGYNGLSGQPVDARNPKRGTIFDEWELVEWSIVPVPANSEALRMALSARWEGKRLCESIARKFKSLLKPSKTLILPATLPTPKKRTKAMADETVPVETNQLPAGAQGIKVVMDGVATTLAAVQEVYPTIEQPQVIKLLDKFMEQLKNQLGVLVKGGASIYPELDIFNVADEETETDVETEAEDDSETEADEADEGANDDVSDVSDKGDEPEDDDKKDKAKSLKRKGQRRCIDCHGTGEGPGGPGDCDSCGGTGWTEDKSGMKGGSSGMKGYEPHVESLKDAAELLDDMSKSANIPSGYKRQCKGVLPGVTSACSWLSGKGEEPEETQPVNETKADDDEMSDEDEAAVKKGLEQIQLTLKNNAVTIAQMRKAG